MADGQNIDNPNSSPGPAGARSTPDQGVRSLIDALVVGALYDELTPAEQARLSAHLETAPTDRQSLDELRATRQQIRESRVLDHDADPPQSVSALLLQEAARRAPKRDAEPGWFARFVAALVAHPALASVASLVLVVGVAGTLYVKNGQELVAERAVTQSPPSAEFVSGAAASSPAEAAEQVMPAAPAVGSRADDKGVPVSLDDVSKRGGGQDLREGKRADSNPLRKQRVAQPKAAPERAKDAKSALGRAKSDGALAAKKSTQNLAVESVDSPFDQGAAGIAADREAEGDEAPAGKFAAPPRPTASAAAPRQSASVAAEPPMAAPAGAGNAYGGVNSAKQEAQSATWVRSAHERVLALVRAGKCQDASQLVRQIWTRDPAYYAANVATDRRLGPCMDQIADAFRRSAESSKKGAAKAGVAQ